MIIHKLIIIKKEVANPDIGVLNSQRLSTGDSILHGLNDPTPQRGTSNRLGQTHHLLRVGYLELLSSKWKVPRPPLSSQIEGSNR